MTPEELNELRKSAAMVTQIGIHNAEICKHPYNGVNNASFALVNLPGLLAHIDQQAAQIEALKEDIEVMKLGEKAADDSDTGGAMSNSVDICPFDDDLTCPLDYHTCEIYRERMEEEQ